MKTNKPRRITYCYTQTLCSAAKIVFPLLCPVMEAEWVNGWDPSMVFTDSGYAEQDCIFLNPDNSIWIINRYDPDNFNIEFIKFIPDCAVGTIRISLFQKKEDVTLADVSYSYTAIDPEGKSFLDQFTAQYFVSFMQTWESELNHYLQHGIKKPA